MEYTLKLSMRLPNSGRPRFDEFMNQWTYKEFFIDDLGMEVNASDEHFDVYIECFHTQYSADRCRTMLGKFQDIAFIGSYVYEYDRNDVEPFSIYRLMQYRELMYFSGITKEDMNEEVRNAIFRENLYMDNEIKLALLDKALLIDDGNYYFHEISWTEAGILVERNINNIDSAVVHKTNAEVMGKLLHTNVPVSNQEFKQRAGQMALVFKMNEQIEEGRKLTFTELMHLDYKFMLLVRTE